MHIRAMPQFFQAVHTVCVCVSAPCASPHKLLYLDLFFLEFSFVFKQCENFQSNLQSFDERISIVSRYLIVDCLAWMCINVQTMADWILRRADGWKCDDVVDVRRIRQNKRRHQISIWYFSFQPTPITSRYAYRMMYEMRPITPSPTHTHSQRLHKIWFSNEKLARDSAHKSNANCWA